MGVYYHFATEGEPGWRAARGGPVQRMRLYTAFTRRTEDRRWMIPLRVCGLMLVWPVLVTMSTAPLLGQRQAEPQPPTAVNQPDKPTIDPISSPTMFPHSESSRYILSGQANIIFQAHAPFHSPYDGLNSLIARGEYKTSLLGTLFLGVQVRRDPYTGTDAILDVESSGGRGISAGAGAGGVYESRRGAESYAWVEAIYGAGAAAPDDRTGQEAGGRQPDAVLAGDRGCRNGGWSFTWAR